MHSFDDSLRVEHFCDWEDGSVSKVRPWVGSPAGT